MDSTRTRRRLAVAAVLAGLWVLFGAGGSAAQDTTAGAVGVTEVRGVITPVIADHLDDAIEEADRRGLQALVIELDTPGGLAASMRLIIEDILNAPLPVIIHVTPAGADAASAGTLITLSAHIAAMSPATTIGAATPVDMEGGEVGDKIVNNAAAYAEAIAEERGRDVEFAVESVRDGRAITATEAVEIGVVDLIATDLSDLLDQIDGRPVDVGTETVTLATAEADTVDLDMTWTRRVLQRVADPNVAFVLLSLATLAILYEIANPGIGAGGVLGAISLVLAFYALSVLPVEFAGLALVFVAAVLFAIELAIPGIGAGAAGGTIALLLAGLFLFQRPTGVGVDLTILLPTVVVTGGLAVVITVFAARSRGAPSRVASDALIGRTAVVHGGPHPQVQLDGTYWRVRPADDATELHAGETVRVADRDNLDLIVEPAPSNVEPDTPTKES